MYELVNIFESFLPQLLSYPNPADPLNVEAAHLMNQNLSEYETKVKGLVKEHAMENVSEPQSCSEAEGMSEESLPEKIDEIPEETEELEEEKAKEGSKNGSKELQASSNGSKLEAQEEPLQKWPGTKPSTLEDDSSDVISHASQLSELSETSDICDEMCN